MDDLTTLKGIGKATAGRLVAAGIASFAALAAATPEQFAAIDKLGGSPTEWAGWVSQAKALVPAPVQLDTATDEQIGDQAARIDAARSAVIAAGDAAAAAQESGEADAIEATRLALIDAEAALDTLIGPGTKSQEAPEGTSAGLSQQEQAVEPAGSTAGEASQPAEPVTPLSQAEGTNSTHNPESEADEEGEAGKLAAGLPGVRFQLAETFQAAVAALDIRVMELLSNEGATAASEYLAEQLADLDDAMGHMTKMRAEILRLQVTVTHTESIWPLDAVRFGGAEQPIGVELKVDLDTAIALLASGAAADHPPKTQTEEI